MTDGQVRILHIITKLAVGGAQLNTLISTRDISKMGYHSDILTGPDRPPEGDLFDLAENWNLNIIFAPHLRRTISPLCDYQAFREIKKVIQSGNYHIIHTHGSKARFLGRLAASYFPDVKVIQTAHGWPFYDSMNPLLRWIYVTLEKVGFGLAHANIAVSPRDRDKAVSHRIGHYDDYRIIRSGVEFEEFRTARGSRLSARRKLGIPQDVPVVGSVMRFCEEKAPDVFIDVASKVLRELPETLFVLVGDGPLREQTESWIEQHHLRDSFILPGSRRDIATLLPALDVFLITSRTEGLPRALLESLAAGIPAVSTDVGGIHELVTGERNGLLFPEGDVNSLSEGVLELLRSPERVKELLRTVDDDLDPFSAEKMVEDLYHLYTNIRNPSMRIAFLCDDEPFNIPDMVECVIRKAPFNHYSIISLPGHGSFASPHANLRRYSDLLGLRKIPWIVSRFLYRKLVGFLRLPLRRTCSLRQAASRMNADYVRIQNINSKRGLTTLKSINPDVIISVACPQILREAVLSIPPRGAWNVHSSLLPKNRGMLPTFWSLYNGDSTGVTMHLMDSKLDSGGILLQESIEASIETTSLFQLLAKAKKTAVDVISKGIQLIETNEYALLQNPTEQGSYNSFPSRKEVELFLDRGGSITGEKVPRPRVALSFDIEEWFQTYAARRWHPREQWDKMKERTPDILLKILDILDAHNARATFFFLGWIFERHSDLAEMLANRGHEIGYHGFHHQELTSQSRESFKRNLDLFLLQAEKTSIPTPVGFRAPSFSITSKTNWVVDEIVSKGFLYDSSVYPMFRHRYGIPSAPLSPFHLAGDEESILELPLASARILGIKLPMAGGAYMRFYPGFLHRWVLSRISSSGRTPVLYFHPWEIDSLNTSDSMNPVQRFRQHHNSGRKTISRLKKILRLYRGIPLRELADEVRDVEDRCPISLDDKTETRS